MTVTISEITNRKLIKMANKYDANKNGTLEEGESQSLFSKLENKQFMYQHGVGKLSGVCIGAMYGAAATVTAMDRYAKSAKNIDKLNTALEKASKKNVVGKSLALVLGITAVCVGTMYLGGVIGKSVDKKQNEKIEACKQELSLLKDAHYLY